MHDGKAENLLLLGDDCRKLLGNSWKQVTNAAWGFFVSDCTFLSAHAYLKYFGGEIRPNNRLAALPWGLTLLHLGNPGSATGFCRFNLFYSVMSLVPPQLKIESCALIALTSAGY